MQSIEAVIEQAKRRSPHQHQLTAAGLACAWKATMPAVVQQRTTRTFYQAGKFFVQLSSAPLRQSLQLNKSQVVADLQAHLNTNEPIAIVFL